MDKHSILIVFRYFCMYLSESNQLDLDFRSKFTLQNCPRLTRLSVKSQFLKQCAVSQYNNSSQLSSLVFWEIQFRKGLRGAFADHKAIS